MEISSYKANGTGDDKTIKYKCYQYEFFLFKDAEDLWAIERTVNGKRDMAIRFETYEEAELEFNFIINLIETLED